MALTGYVSGLIVQSVPTKGNMKVDRFTADGTFTPPAGVTYAIAHIRAGGGSTGTAGFAAGGNSSVAFAGGTITATGGAGMQGQLPGAGTYQAAGAANSGNGALTNSNDGTTGASFVNITAQNGAYIVAGGAVTAGTGITVTVGAGGTAGTSGAAGGSGYVWIEYEQPVGAGL
jgi:hypothetical protein